MVAQGRGHQAVTGAFGVAGLHAIHVGVVPQQAVAVVLLDAVVLILALTVERVVLRKVAGEGGGEQRQVVGRGVVLRVGQAGGIDEMGVVHAQALCFPVHLFGEGGFAAGNQQRQLARSIIGRLDDHAVHQLIHRYRLARVEEHARFVGL